MAARLALVKGVGVSTSGYFNFENELYDIGKMSFNPLGFLFDLFPLLSPL